MNIRVVFTSGRIAFRRKGSGVAKLSIRHVVRTSTTGLVSYNDTRRESENGNQPYAGSVNISAGMEIYSLAKAAAQLVNGASASVLMNPIDSVAFLAINAVIS